MNKLKAFTILELVIAMALVSVVASIAYTVIESAQLQFRAYKQGQASLGEVSQLNSLLLQDADRCTQMIKTQHGVYFIKPNDTATYIFETDFIARLQAGQPDTFKLSPEEFAAFYAGNSQLLPGALIDHVQFIAYLDNNAFPFAAHKQYDARFLLQQEQQE